MLFDVDHLWAEDNHRWSKIIHRKENFVGIFMVWLSMDDYSWVMNMTRFIQSTYFPWLNTPCLMQEQKEVEIKKLRQSLNFKATPMPGFYQGQRTSKSNLNKVCASSILLIKMVGWIIDPHIMKVP